MSLLCGALLLGALQMAEANTAAVQAEASAPQPTKELKETDNYTVTSAPVDQLHLPDPKLPDLSGYTRAAVDAKIVRKPGGSVSVKRMMQQDALKDFIGGNERLREWVTRQRGMPQAIFVEGGYVTPKDLAKKLPPASSKKPRPAYTSPACRWWSPRARPCTSARRSRTCACPRSAARSWSTTACCSSPAAS